MITRIQIDGFKTLQNVDIPLRPFQAFAGPNNVGKSNLFDALRLLSMLPDHELPDILQSLRGDPFEMFTQLPDGSFVNRIRMSVDLLLNPYLDDDFEGRIELKNNVLQYQIDIERDNENGRTIRVAREQLLVKTDQQALPWEMSEQFKEYYCRSDGRKKEYISINSHGEIAIHKDPIKPGRPRMMRSGTRQSVLSIIRDAGVFPHIVAVRNELQHWQFVHLDPEVMREPNVVDGPDQLTGNGKYLAACLHRMMQEDERMRYIIAAQVQKIIPGAKMIDVRHIEELHRYLVELHTRDGRIFSSRVLSDGTLRLLGLLVLQHDPVQQGLICLEEPENGVHPRRLSSIVSILKGMSTDVLNTDISPEDIEPLRQVFVNTHSPGIINRLDLSDLVLAEAVTYLPKHGASPSRYTRYRHIVPSTSSSDSAQTDEPSLERLRSLLEEQDLGELWVSGALGGVP